MILYMEERICILTGSFDPVTSGHADLLVRAARLFDRVYAVVLDNGKKDATGGGMFTYEERLALLQATVDDLRTEGFENIFADSFSGLTSDYAKKIGARFIVRGARNASDFDYEVSIAEIMKRFDPDIETVILPAAPKLACISSTYVRELLRYGCEIGDAMTPTAAARAIDFLQKRNKS